MWMSEARVSTASRDQEVDQPDDRRLARQVAQPLDIVVGRALLARRGGVDDLGERRAGGAVQALERRLDRGRRGEAQQHRLLGDQLDRARRVAVVGVGDCEHDARGAVGERQHERLLEELHADLAVEHHGVGKLVGLRERQAEARRERGGHVGLGDQAELGQQPVDPLAAALLQAARALEPRRVELAAADQQLAELQIELAVAAALAVHTNPAPRHRTAAALDHRRRAGSSADLRHRS